MIFRKANIKDLEQIVELVKSAIENMISLNILQWDEIYPTRDDFEKDILNGQLYVGIVENTETVENIENIKNSQCKKNTEITESMRITESIQGTKNVHEKIAVIWTLNKEFDDEYKNGKWSNPNSNFYIIHRLCVHPNFQHRGIATKVMRQIEQQVKDFGGNEIRLDVFSQNPYSLKLYDNAGYKKTGEANWRKGLFYLMEKHL